MADKDKYRVFRKIVGSYRRIQMPVWCEPGDVVEIRLLKVTNTFDNQGKRGRAKKPPKEELITEEEAGDLIDDLEVT